MAKERLTSVPSFATSLLRSVCAALASFVVSSEAEQTPA
jgi:hypothetical protein